jgi:hypothetical protein
MELSSIKKTKIRAALENKIWQYKAELHVSRNPNEILK